MSDKPTTWCTVIEPGPLTTVQDGGRPGLADVAVSPSGAFDQPARRLANRLVGNDPGEAVLETTFGALVLRFEQSGVVALTGAPVEVRVGGHAQGMGHALFVAAGETVRLGRPPIGVRTWVAIRGGLHLEEELGSRSTDLLSGLGPSPLAAGDRVEIGSAVVGDPSADAAPIWRPEVEPTLRLRAGPRFDWIEPDSLADLVRMPVLVGDQANRIGVRFESVPLVRSRHDELPSEPVIQGAMQIPPDGQPIVFGPDHPTTGGYPVAAVVEPDDMAALAQLRPGDLVRFVWVGSAER